MNAISAVDGQIQQFDGLHEKTEKFDELTLLLKRHSTSKSLCNGRLVHASVVAHGYDADTFMSNCLVQMYGDCGSLCDAEAAFSRTPAPNLYSWNILLRAYTQGGCFQDAKAIFNQMPCKDVVSWNSIVRASLQHGYPGEALNLFFAMQKDGIQPSRISLITALDACCNLSSLDCGHHIHACIIETGFDRDDRVGSALINMHGKCEDLEGAEVVFGKMQDCNLISWSAMISAYARNGKCRDALALFYRMQAEGIEPDEVTFLSALTACANLGDVAGGQQIHAAILVCKLEKYVNVGNALINMYAKCGDLCKAKQAFDQMVERDVVSWTALIGASLQAGQDEEALDLFSQMQREGIKPNHVTFVYGLDACANLRALDHGMKIHDTIRNSGHIENVFVGNALVNMYGKCGLLEEAKGFFSTMKQKSVASWNTLMTVYVQSGFVDKALNLFEQIPEKNVISWNALISGMVQSGHPNKAMDFFNKMLSKGINPNTSTFVSIIDACASLKDNDRGLLMHTTIICAGNEQDVILQNALVNMYGKCGRLEMARFVFDTIQQKNLISWSAMIAAYVQNGEGNKALGLFWEMLRHGVIPDAIMLTCPLAACADAAIVEEGQKVHAAVIAYGFESCLAVGNSLLSMYGKCGSLDNSKVVFSKMHYRDVISWTTIIAGCAQRGESKEALELFAQMQIEGIKPDKITYVGVMAACCHSGQVGDGRGYFSSMAMGDQGSVFKSDHYLCMVDLLGRAGHLAEAEELIYIMPKDKLHLAWLSLLSSCRNHGDIKRGIGAALCCFQLEPTSDTPFPLLWSLLSVAGKHSDQYQLTKLLNHCHEDRIEDLMQGMKKIVYDRL